MQSGGGHGSTTATICPPRVQPGQPAAVAERSGDVLASARTRRRSPRPGRKARSFDRLLLLLRLRYAAERTKQRKIVGLGNNTKDKQTHYSKHSSARHTCYELYSKCITIITMVMGYHIPSSAQSQRVTVAEKPPHQIRT